MLVRDSEGATIAAIGISGDNSTNDEDCAVFGVESVGLAADPGGGGDHPTR